MLTGNPSASTCPFSGTVYLIIIFCLFPLCVLNENFVHFCFFLTVFASFIFVRHIIISYISLLSCILCMLQFCMLKTTLYRLLAFCVPCHLIKLIIIIIVIIIIDLKIELQRMWKVWVVIVPLIIWCLGSVSRCLVKNLKSLNIFYGTLVAKLQKIVLLNSCHILRRFVTEHI